MYEELIKHLQIVAQWADKGLSIPPLLLLEAADVIKELSAIVMHNKEFLEQYGGETGIKNLQEYASKYWDLLKKCSSLDSSDGVASQGKQRTALA